MTRADRNPYPHDPRVAAMFDVAGAEQCWPWRGDAPETGRTLQIRWRFPGERRARLLTVGRLATWASTGQEVPKGRRAVSRCRNPMCGNPAHYQVIDPKRPVKRAAPLTRRKCRGCGEWFLPARIDQWHHEAQCRVRAMASRRSGVAAELMKPKTSSHLPLSRELRRKIDRLRGPRTRELAVEDLVDAALEDLRGRGRPAGGSSAEKLGEPGAEDWFGDV